MNIWIISPYDAIPGETWGHKHGLFLSETLTSKGHTVTFWSSTYSHALKRVRTEESSEFSPSHGTTVKLLKVSPYSDHVGFTRLLALFQFAWRLWRAGRQEQRPDAIFISMPVPFSDVVSVLLAKRHKSILISEFRDLWPEIFEGVFPHSMRWLAKLLLSPLYWARKFTFAHSTGFLSVCETYMGLALQIAPQLRKRPHAVMYHTGVDLANFKALMQEPASDAQMMVKVEGEIWVLYAGTLGINYDIETLLQAAKQLHDNPKAKRVQVLIAGDGPMKERIIQFKAQQGLTNLHYVGALNTAQLYQYYAKCNIGLSIYSPNSTVIIPAKAFDYFVAQLPIINSLKGEFAAFIQAHQIGTSYAAGDAASLAEAMLGMASDAEALAAMRARMAPLSATFVKEIQYGKVEEILRQALPVGVLA